MVKGLRSIWGETDLATDLGKLLHRPGPLSSFISKWES